MEPPARGCGCWATSSEGLCAATHPLWAAQAASGLRTGRPQSLGACRASFSGARAALAPGGPCRVDTGRQMPTEPGAPVPGSSPQEGARLCLVTGDGAWLCPGPQSLASGSAQSRGQLRARGHSPPCTWVPCRRVRVGDAFTPHRGTRAPARRAHLTCPRSAGSEEPDASEAQHRQLPARHHGPHQAAGPQVPAGLQRAERDRESAPRDTLGSRRRSARDTARAGGGRALRPRSVRLTSTHSELPGGSWSASNSGPELSSPGSCLCLRGAVCACPWFRGTS